MSFGPAPLREMCRSNSKVPMTRLTQATLKPSSCAKETPVQEREGSAKRQRRTKPALPLKRSVAGRVSLLWVLRTRILTIETNLLLYNSKSQTIVNRNFSKTSKSLIFESKTAPLHQQDLLLLLDPPHLTDLIRRIYVVYSTNIALILRVVWLMIGPDESKITKHFGCHEGRGGAED